jgi:hypothetical protein
MIMLGEAKFQFTRALEGLGCGPLASSTNAFVPNELRNRGYWESIDATRLHTNPRVIRALAQQLRIFCWNFPYITTNDDNIMVEEENAEHELLILETFMSLSLLHEIACACLAFGPAVPPFTFALTLQGDQFSRWSVLRSAWRTGWNLVGWSAFDSSLFPGYTPSRHSGTAFQADRSRFYVFSSH